jgi:phosphohistidine swiveling domain-containing protein
MAGFSVDRFRKWIQGKEWVKGAVNYDEDFHFSTFYLRASHAQSTAPLYPGYTSIVAFYEGFNECYYLLRSECLRTASAIVQKALRRPAWLPKILRTIERRSDALAEVFGPETSPAGLARLETAEILSLYRKHAAGQRLLYKYARLPEALDRGDGYFSSYLNDYLRQLGLAPAACEATFAALAQPVVPSVLAQEILEFEEIVRLARADPPFPPPCEGGNPRTHPLAKGGEGGDSQALAGCSQGRARMFLRPELLQRLRAHREKWKYLPYHGYGRRELATLGEYVERLVEHLNHPEANGHAPGLRQRASRAQQERRELLTRLRMDRAHQALFLAYPQIGAVKLYRRYAQLRTFYHLDMLLAEIADRIGVNEWTLRCMLPEEIVSALKTGREVSAAVRERVSGCMYALLPDGEFLVAGDQARELHRLFQARVRSRPGGRVLKGTVACRGTAVGPCKVIIRADDCREGLAPGSIVVSESTDPDLIGFLKKAGGVLTEQGGVTSHAAIICRELGVPTIIGVEGLLDRVRDGDVVEVDGERGLITLVREKAAPPPGVVFPAGEASTAEVIGAKAYNLGVVRSLGFPVPEYVAVSYEGVKRLTGRASPGPCKRLVRWALEQLRLPAGGKLALRSSAVGEDRDTGSHAGEYQSLLNVAPDQLAAALGEFVRVNGARRRRGTGYRGSLLIQRMVEAEYAGVCLTSDSRTGSANAVILELVAGGNQSVTQGTVRPDRLVVDRLTGDIREHQRAGNKRLPPVIDVGHLVHQFLTLEAEFGKPLDIEWALADQKLYILQARPIVPGAGKGRGG